MAPEHLPAEAFGAISLDGRTNLACCCYSKSRRRSAVRHHEQSHEPAMYPRAVPVDAFEFGSAANTLGGGQYLAAHAPNVFGRAYRSSATVSRLRPFARRRFKTIRPFLVDIRTRNPCVFFRRLVLGWKVRLPFMLVLCGRGVYGPARRRAENFQY